MAEEIKTVEAAEAAAKKPAAKRASTKTNGATVTITLKKSLIACKKKHIATALSLGLKRPGDVTVQPDNAATRGKIAVISHMVEVH